MLAGTQARVLGVEEGGSQIPRLVSPAAPASQQKPPTLPRYLSVPSLGRAASTVVNGRAGEPLDLKRLMDLWGYCISHKHAHT